MNSQRRSRNSTRDREAAELRALRLLARELETHVASLLTQPQSRRPSNKFWKRVAERQAIASRTSQRENRLLLAEIQYRADWIERLWTLLRETRMRRHDFFGEVRLQATAVDAAIVAKLRANESALASWETALSVFAAEGVPLGGCCGGQEQQDRWSMTVDVANGQSRLVGQRHLPFDAHTTTKAIWAALTIVASSSGAAFREDTPCGNFVVFERTHDVCAMKYSLRSLDRSSAMMRCHALVQAVDHRAVACADCSRSEEEPLFGGATVFLLQSDCSISGGIAVGKDTMYVAISNCPGSTLTSTVSIVAHPRLESPQPADPMPFNMFLEEMTRATEACVRETLASAENSLVDTEIQPRKIDDMLAKDVIVV